MQEYLGTHQNGDAIRMIPYLPSFKRIPAKIIDPATGASTCAFGSHRWVKNSGIFTKKARIEMTHHIRIKWFDGATIKFKKINKELFF